MKTILGKIWFTIKATFKKFGQDQCTTLAAALSYYMIFSLAPMLLIVIALVGILFGKEAISGQIYHQIKDLVGNDGALAIQTFIEHTYEPHNSLIATVVSVITLIFASTGVFTQLKHSLNSIWNVRPNARQEFLKLLVDRLLSFAFILGIGFILIVTLVINAFLAILGDLITRFFASYSIYILNIAHLVITVSILSFLFAAMFKVLPDAISKWKDILIGGFLTSVLFLIGELLIGLYLGNSNFASTYGAAGSIIIILVWVNYSSLILFLGATFTYIYSQNFGTPIMPNKLAIKIKVDESKSYKLKNT